VPRQFLLVVEQVVLVWLDWLLEIRIARPAHFKLVCVMVTLLTPKCCICLQSICTCNCICPTGSASLIQLPDF
jgi:hypothetical protein